MVPLGNNLVCHFFGKVYLVVTCALLFFLLTDLRMEGGKIMIKAEKSSNITWEFMGFKILKELLKTELNRAPSFCSFLK